MDHHPDNSVINDAVLNIVNYKPKPQSRTTRQPSSERSTSGKGKGPEPQDESQQGSASLPAYNDFTGPLGPSAGDSSQPVSQLPTAQTSHQLARKVPYFKRIAAPDEAPTTPFSFGKHEPRTLNCKPTRGPAAIVCEANTVIAQPASSDPAKSSGDDTTSSEGQEPMSKLELKQREEPESEYARPKPNTSIVLPEQSPPSLEHPNRAPCPHDCNSGHDAANLEKRSTPETLQCASVLPTYSSVGEQSFSTVPVPESVLETTEQNEATSEKQIAKPTAYDLHDEDTAMIDERTLVDQETRSHTNTRRGRSHSSSPSNVDLPGPQGAGKVRKRPQRPRNKSSSLSDIADTGSKDNSDIDPEELLKALKIHYQYQKQQRHQTRAREQGRDRDIQDLQTISQALHEQLQETEARVAGQEQELTKYRRLVPQCKDRLTKLGNFLRGLSNDHTRLRDIGDTIETEQKSLRAQKDSMDNMLKDTVRAMEDERVRYRERILEHRQVAKMLEQALNTRSLDLLNENSRLRAEQGRNATLQEHLVESTSRYEDLAAKLVQDGRALGSKIGDLRGLFQATACNSQPVDQVHLNKKLDECLRLLKDSPHGQFGTPDIVEKLDLSNKEYAASLSQLISACGNSAEATTQLGSQLKIQLEAKFEKLISIIETGHPLREQIMDLREMRATVAEQLKATEASLVKSRLRVAASENKEQMHLQKISTLEAVINTLRNQPPESPLSALRLHEAEKQSAQFRDQLSICQSQLEIMKADVDTKCHEASDLHGLLESAKADLAEQKAKTEIIISEKQAIQHQAVQNEEIIRAELSQTCTNEISRSTHKFLNEIQGLRHQLSTMEEKLKTEKGRVEQLQNDRFAALEDVVQKESSVNELWRQLNASRELVSHSERNMEEACQKRINSERELEKTQNEFREVCESRQQDAEVIKGLRSRLDDAEALNGRLGAEITESSERLKESEELLNGANAELKTKEAHIQDLMRKSSSATKANSASDSSSIVHPVDHRSRKEDAVIIEDSQDRVPKQRPGILKPRMVVEDSQLRAAKDRPSILEPRTINEDSQDRDSQQQPGESEPRPIVEESLGIDINACGQQHGPLSSSDELNRDDPLSFTQETQAFLARSLSPLTDAQPTSSPVTDGGVMFPPSPMTGKKRNSLGKEPPRSTPSMGHPSPKRPGTTQSGSQLSNQSSGTPKKGVLKRVRPTATAGVNDLESHHKRRRLSSEIEKLGLGPTQKSPIKAAGSSRRKSTLRHSQRDDKYSQRFSQELKKER
ncbi:MAG: hypothetical protein LQ343_004787 [Gyalolechia ehrenbergii]|nr:MAG: hypothetical protein LQ343_004787 [Gyalolechia ehrenbergii]